ncbi:MAG: hypothetical protein ACQEXV_25200 [Bacillota bacterium]
MLRRCTHPWPSERLPHGQRHNSLKEHRWQRSRPGQSKKDG